MTTEPNRVVVRKCPNCTRLVVQFVVESTTFCEHCKWTGDVRHFPPIEYDDLPADPRDQS